MLGKISGKGPDQTVRLAGLAFWFIILGFLCKPVNIDLDFCLALVIFESCSSNFSPNKYSFLTASKFNVVSFSNSFTLTLLSIKVLMGY